MTLKKLFILGGVLAGAAYLQNKSRRDRLITQGRDLFDRAKTRASKLAHRVESEARESAGSVGRGDGLGTTASTTAGVTSGYSGIGSIGGR